jgi:16S rRNA processing protein RimM
LVGRVIRPHGLRGEVKVEVDSDVPERFAVGAELDLVTRDRTRRRVRVAGVRPLGGRATGGAALVRFEGYGDRDRAEALRGGRLEVDASEVPAAPAGMYYHFQLVGCRCVDADRGELGEVVGLLEDGGGALLQVAGAGSTLLVPFVEAFLESVDVAEKRIDLKLPPGLVETCASKS